MQMDQKLREADFFLSFMAWAVEVENMESLNYFMSAFLSAIRSVTDVALEDANYLFVMKIPEDVPSLRSEFRKKVTSGSDTEVKKFYREWDRKRRSIDNDRFIRFRHISIHRKPLEIGKRTRPFEITPALANREGIRFLPPFLQSEKGLFVQYGFRLKGLRGDVFDNSARIRRAAEEFVSHVKPFLPSLRRRF